MPGFNPVSKGSDIREILTRLGDPTGETLATIVAKLGDPSTALGALLEHGTYGLEALKNAIDGITAGLIQSVVAEGTKTADGTEQDLVNTSGRGKYEGWVDLANMQAGDTVVIKEYVRLKSGGSWRLYATTTYNDAQTEPATHATRKLSEYGWRVSLQQTGGVNRDYDYWFGKEAGA